MSDLTTISAVLTSLRTAADIAKILSDTSGSLEKAEMKLKLAEMYEALAEARVAATDLREELERKDQEIARLLDACALKDEVVKAGDGYFKKNSGGEPTGDPFCVYCWDNEKKLVHIHRTRVGQTGPEQFVCPKCKTGVQFYSIPWSKVKSP